MGFPDIFRRLPRRDRGVLIVILIGLGILLGAVWWLPLGVQEHPVVRIEHVYRQALLNAGETIEETFKSKHGAYKGAIVYSREPFLGDRKVELTLLDKDDHVLAVSQHPAISYLPGDDTMALRFSWPTVKDQQDVFLKARFRLLEGPPLSIKVSSRSYDGYTSGNFTRNGELVSRDMGLTVLVAAPLESGQAFGVTAGVATLLIVLLIWLLKDARWQWVVAGIGLVFVTPLALGGFWFSVDQLGIADWDYYFSQHENYRQTILQYHQFPFWNPWTCGGTAGLADPEFPGFTITFLLELLFGVPVGLRLAIWTSVAVTAVGMLMLARRLQLSALAGFLVGIAAAFSSVSLLEIVEGHVNVLAVMWIPWVFYAWYASYKMQTSAAWHRYVILGGIFLALTFYAAGIYLLMYTGLAFLFLIFLAPHHRQAASVLVRAGAIALGLAAFKLIPVLLWLREFPDDAYASSTVTLPWLYDIFLGRHLHGSYILFRQDSGWHEYGAYIGLPVLCLALIGAAAYWKRRLVQALVIAVVAAMLLSSTGPGIKSLFDMLWFFPRSNISRFILFAVVPLALLAGFGFDRLQKSWKGPAICILIGIVALDLMSLTYPLSLQSFVLPHVQPPLPEAAEPLEITSERFDDSGQGSRYTRTYDATLAGYGTTAYCSVLGPKPFVALHSDEDGDMYVHVKHQEAKAQLLSWSPNKVVVRVETPVASEVTLNTNYVQGWEVNQQPAREIAGRVGANVPPGVHELTFIYRTPGLMVGFLVTLSTLGMLVFLGRAKIKG